MKIKIVFLAALSFFLAFVGTAFAASTVTAIATADPSLFELAKPILDAVKNGNGWLAAALTVVFLCAFTRRYLPDGYGGKWIRGDLGGLFTAFLFAFGGAVATVLAAGAAMSGSVVLVALKVGISAVGGYTAIHKLASALTASAWYQAKAPAWLKVAVGFMLALIGSNAVAKAEAAGDAAVKANPAKGSGEFTEI